MSHKKKPASKKPSKPLPPRLYAALYELAPLAERGQWARLLLPLQELNRQFPHRLEVLEMLTETCAKLDYSDGYEQSAAELLTLIPEDPELHYNLGLAYFKNMRPALAMKQLRHFIQTWPEHEMAHAAGQLLAILESSWEDIRQQLGLPPETPEEVVVLHERVTSITTAGNYQEGRRLAEQLTREAPHLTSGWNNLSQLQWLEGRRKDAIVSARKTLEIAPDNVHALGNLVRFYLLSGLEPEARAVAESLQHAPAQGGEQLTKKAEAFSYLGEDKVVLEVLHNARRDKMLPQRGETPLLYHLAAVAHARQGDEGRARQHWQTALDISPDFELARENLKDFKQKIGERHAPWAYSIQYWIEEKIVRELHATASKSPRNNPDALTRTLQRWLSTHEFVEHLAPHMLDRGDGPAREFALMLAESARTPRLLEAARDFSQGQRGPDAMRYRAASLAFDAGYLQNPVRLWWQGSFQEVELLSFDIDYEPVLRKNKAVLELLELGQNSYSLGYYEGAEQFYRRALILEPSAPDLKNNLASVLIAQGKKGDGIEILRAVVEEHPNYLFSRLSLARLALADHKVQDARALIEPLINLRRFHASEFRAWAQVQIELALAEKQRETARRWLDLWRESLPDDTLLQEYEKKVR